MNVPYATQINRNTEHKFKTIDHEYNKFTNQHSYCDIDKDINNTLCIKDILSDQWQTLPIKALSLAISNNWHR